MLKKLFNCLMTLTILVGCYLGYVRVFAFVVVRLTAIKRSESPTFAVHDSKSKLESIRFAREACGPDHWSANDDLAYRYYNAERRYWIYAKVCERIIEENGVRYDGKRIRLTPFLLISKSSDGKKTQIITSDVAVFDLSDSLSFNVASSGEPLKIRHARLEPNVWIRDDKGTPNDRNDDMKIGPLTNLEYEESTQQITSQLDTYVVIQDPEISATAYGMIMQLRKTEATTPSGSSGFEGVERVDLLKNVHVVIRDVGKSGLVPGSAPVKKTASEPSRTSGTQAVPSSSSSQTAKAAEPTPLDLRCDSKMQAYLPKPKLPVVTGPPAPPAPTLVQFDRNVVVLRGKIDARPDQLTCDTLKLSLIPAEKAEKAAAAAESSNPLGGLTLQRVHATGHAVWLYLPAQGIKLVCNELIHERRLPYKPDQTYFRGDRTRSLQLEKVDVVAEEGPDKGKITSVTNIWTVDATLFDSGVGLDAANVVAHGPGRLETRADRNKPVERIAIWQDSLIVHNRLGSKNEVVHKVIDLTGTRPCFIDCLEKTSLDSASWIQVWLKPKPAPPIAAIESGSTTALASNAGVRGTGSDLPPPPPLVVDRGPQATREESTSSQTAEAAQPSRREAVSRSNNCTPWLTSTCSRLQRQ